MKRDPRLRPLGERHAPRRLHGRARLLARQRLILARVRADTSGFGEALRRAARSEREFLDGLREHATRTSERLARDALSVPDQS